MATASRVPSSLQSTAGAATVVTSQDVERRQLLLGMSGEMSDRIDNLSERTGYETGELIDVALALLQLSLDAVEQGKQVGVAAENQELELGFTGFHKNDPFA